MAKYVRLSALFVLLFALSFTLGTALQTTGLLSQAQTIVIPLKPPPPSAKDSLQMGTFNFVTLTPSPVPTNPTTGGTGTGGGGGLPGDLANNVPPSTSDCGKPEYKRYMNMLSGDKKGKNYGDPQCTFTKDKLKELLKKLDPKNAEQWFCLADPESGYNPNAFLANSTSGHGAYGLYQMNAPPNTNGQYDNGYVVWTLQVSNAINYRNKVINGSWAYWDARSQAKCPGF